MVWDFHFPDVILYCKVLKTYDIPMLLTLCVLALNAAWLGSEDVL